jgi:hypothetical protein
MEKGEIDKAQQMFSDDLKAEAPKEEVEEFAKRIGDSNIVSLECTDGHGQEHMGGNRYFLYYDVEYEQNYSYILMCMLENNDEFTVQGIGLRDPNFDSFALGSQSYDDMEMQEIGETFKDFGSILGRFFCGIAILFIMLVLIQVVSWWIVFEKAGHPGWAAIIPFYNMWVLARVGDLSGWVGIGAITAGGVPVVGSILQTFLWITLSVGVAKAFDRGYLFAAGLFLLPFIFYPILAFVD